MQLRYKIVATPQYNPGGGSSICIANVTVTLPGQPVGKLGTINIHPMLQDADEKVLFKPLAGHWDNRAIVKKHDDGTSELSLTQQYFFSDWIAWEKGVDALIDEITKTLERVKASNEAMIESMPSKRHVIGSI